MCMPVGMRGCKVGIAPMGGHCASCRRVGHCSAQVAEVAVEMPCPFNGEGGCHVHCAR